MDDDTRDLVLLLPSFLSTLVFIPHLITAASSLARISIRRHFSKRTKDLRVRNVRPNSCLRFTENVGFIREDIKKSALRRLTSRRVKSASVDNLALLTFFGRI